MSTSAPTLADRYGKRPTWRRKIVVPVFVVAALGGAAWSIWLAWFHGTPSVHSQILTWEVASDTEVSVRFDVALEGDEAATCRVRALAASHEAVGDASVEVTEPGVVTHAFRTFARADAVELVGCTTPSQKRPR
ncbi:MAG TPA: DUF4307 domain-containing protein [Nocardioides sp.]